MFTNRQIICVLSIANVVVSFVGSFVRSFVRLPLFLFTSFLHVLVSYFKAELISHYAVIDHLTCNSHFCLWYRICINNVLIPLASSCGCVVVVYVRE